MKTRKQINKTFKEVNDKHRKLFRIYNSPVDLGYTEQHKYAMLKWLERFAGFIQALRWVLKDEEKLPEHYYSIPDY